MSQIPLTDEQKLEIVIEHLTRVHDGGYAGDYVWVGDTMAYTSSRGGSFSDLEHDASLGTITRQEMLDWVDRAIAFCKRSDWDDDDVSGVLNETAP